MAQEWDFDGTRGKVSVREWANEGPRYIAVLVHGYGEHIGRYDHVAETLVRDGAAVYGPDHIGHGKSDGDRVLITDFEDVVADVHTVTERARALHPDVPVVLIGHSMGGMIAARYAQRYAAELAGLVLSGPVIGSWAQTTSLLDLEEIPDEPIDTATLSRDPAVGERYNADPLIWHGPFKRPMIAAIDTMLKTINAGPGFGSLPTIWLHGEADRLVPREESRAGVERLRGADFTEIGYPGAEHEIFNETNKDLVLADVTSFIDRVLA